ncbi:MULTISPECIES: hypothetical protein [unclassified Streptomyces]|uniref:hypothetical protein n=1 Tax=unclassified Streptomyces TaxID=2593676 RepID=UPI002DDB7F54|nr:MULTISPECIES: hypothetical protein [unclassified Streptomyces]WSF87151.1 hypothetical protein OIE70_31105 [Streptomyces sp. NBC_01744]WSC36606.1 hypothetical protein OHA08_14335 [Streptomyces sp. NBC_01763]WSC44703.1 hypothetical protein OIE61_12410 [Streptomyces sp. NBC_01762]WSC56314.1 hypothetical protein OG808_30990 [Streptomyces sp. NBC_01761]WSD24290.1 hypothetical protein OHA26_12755 [Streptomyces sp. NBC_01751]
MRSVKPGSGAADDDSWAMAWAGQLDLVDAAGDQARDTSLAARRAAVQRLFPAAATTNELP